MRPPPHAPHALARALACALLLAAPLAARDDPPPSLARQLSYLERNPFHAGAFGRALHEAVEAGWLSTLEERLEARLAADPGDLPARVLLARLAARAHRPDEALALLAALETEDAPLLRLRGELSLQAGADAEAARWLEAALAAGAPRHEREELYALLGRARLRAADRPGAAEAFRALAALDPASFELQLEAGLLLAENGLFAEARAELAGAVERAGDDAARRVRALVELGRACERSGAADEALATFGRAAALLGQGHWQRSELFERRLALARALGREATLAAALGADAAAAPGDAELVRFLARALEAAGDPQAALDTLERGARALPGDVALGRALVDQLAAQGRTGRAAEELERLVALRPEDVALRCEQALLLAADGRLEAALGAWDRALALAPRSVDLRLELARVQEGFGLSTRSEALLREALELAPGDLRAARALTRRFDAGRATARSDELLERLELQAAGRGDAHALEELAGEWLVRERPTRAARALERALDAGGERRPLLSMLATVLEEGRRPEDADPALRQLFDLAASPTARAELVRRLVAVHRSAGRLDALLRSARRAHERAPQALLPALVVSVARAERGELEAAAEPLAARLARDPDDGDAIEHLARLAARRGDHRAAVAHLRRLAELRPGERRALLERVASQLRLAGDTAGLAAVYEELVRAAPESRELLSDLAQTHARARQPQAAIEYLRRALALDPQDGDARLELAQLLERTGQADAARAELLHALVAREAGVRALARERVRKQLARGGALGVALAERRAEVEARPQRPALAVWLALALAAGQDHEGAARELAAALVRFPLEPALLEAREELRGLSAAATAAPFDPALAARVHRREDARGDLELACLLLARDERTRARPLLAGLRHPALASAACLANGLPAEARRVLEAALADDPDDPELALRLALVEELEGHARGAAAALERALELGGERWALLLRLGRAQLARHRRDGARDVAERLLALLARDRAELLEAGPEGRALHARRVAELRDLHLEGGLERAWIERGAEAVRAAPRDAALLDAVLGAMEARHARRARALLADVRAAKEHPPGIEPAAWAAHLDALAARFARGGARR